jgi:hypothetical protein
MYAGGDFTGYTHRPIDYYNAFFSNAGDGNVSRYLYDSPRNLMVENVRDIARDLRTVFIMDSHNVVS